MNNSQPSSSGPGSPPSITLRIRGIGHVPAFKNHKMLTRGRLRTDPKKQKWMAKCIQSIESQLRSWLATADAGTETGQLARSLIAWSQQFDDSLDWIPAHSCDCRMVEKGQEGCEIRVERITVMPICDTEDRVTEANIAKSTHHS